MYLLCTCYNVFYRPLIPNPLILHYLAQEQTYVPSIHRRYCSHNYKSDHFNPEEDPWQPWRLPQSNINWVDRSPPKITCLPSVFERSSQRSLASGLGLVLQVYGMDPLAFITGRINPDSPLLHLWIGLKCGWNRWSTDISFWEGWSCQLFWRMVGGGWNCGWSYRG